MRAGDAAKAQEVLGRIFTANFETKRVSAAAARSLLYQLAATLQRLANSDALAQGGGADFDEQLVEQVVNSSSIDYARRRLSEHIARLAAAHENRAQSKTEKLVERIAAYIDNCAESNSRPYRSFGSVRRDAAVHLQRIQKVPGHKMSRITSPDASWPRPKRC